VAKDSVKLIEQARCRQARWDVQPDVVIEVDVGLNCLHEVDMAVYLCVMRMVRMVYNEISSICGPKEQQREVFYCIELRSWQLFINIIDTMQSYLYGIIM
jgi:hypothetical protein